MALPGNAQQIRVRESSQLPLLHLPIGAQGSAIRPDKKYGAREIVQAIAEIVAVRGVLELGADDVDEDAVTPKRIDARMFGIAPQVGRGIASDRIGLSVDLIVVAW